MSGMGRTLSGERTVIAAILREHRRTTGMAVAMGDTCRCGAWLDGKTNLRAAPRWANDLAQHQADEIVKALSEPARFASPEIPA